MGRILAVDYGRKRCGIAVTDELQLIANGLTTVRSHDVFDFLKNYLALENVNTVVVGEPKDMHNNPSEAARFIEPFINRLRNAFPDLDIQRFDERFTSVMAFQSMIDAGLSKKKRQDKSLVDTISATIILQSFMESQKNRTR